jgi:peptidoglycan L-alanyl-D-glutamate endopeptidase CwlK
MPRFSTRSNERLMTCHPDLQRLMREVIKHIDITVLCGHRGEAEQRKAVAAGVSQKVWPTSMHNQRPSLAVDVAPWPLDWQDIQAFKEVAVVVKECAARLGITIRWGGDWKMRDYPHFELAQPLLAAAPNSGTAG